MELGLGFSRRRDGEGDGSDPWASVVPKSKSSSLLFSTLPEELEMWRQNAFPATVDSDHSFSDEDDIDGDSSKNFVSLSDHAEIRNEGGLQILSQLEKLRDASGSTLARKCNLSTEKREEFAPQDGLEIPNYGNGSDFNFSQKWSPTSHMNEDVISDDENNALSKFPITSRVQRGKESGQSAIMSEASMFNRSNSHGSASLSSSHARQSKPKHNIGGFRRKSKPTLSFVSNEPSVSFISKNEDDFPRKACEESEVHEDSRKQMEYFSEKSESDRMLSHAKVLRGECSTSEHSMAILLDGLHNKIDQPVLIKEISSRKRGQRGLGIRTLPRANRKTDPNVVPESSDSDSPEDEEFNNDELKIPEPERKGNMLVDCFQEVLDATSLSNNSFPAAIPVPSGFGLFGKLQRVMQVEKERELEFMKNLNPELETSGPTCLNVCILSRILEAKLIVCRCLCQKTPEMFQQSYPGIIIGQEITVIFNPRVCNNTDLEVGSLICIYPPWKEVQLQGSSDSILLATYFMQTSDLSI